MSNEINRQDNAKNLAMQSSFAIDEPAPALASLGRK
jgi:hypothetical protein